MDLKLLFLCFSRGRSPPSGSLNNNSGFSSDGGDFLGISIPAEQGFSRRHQAGGDLPESTLILHPTPTLAPAPWWASAWAEGIHPCRKLRQTPSPPIL